MSGTVASDDTLIVVVAVIVAAVAAIEFETAGTLKRA